MFAWRGNTENDLDKRVDASRKIFFENPHYLPTMKAFKDNADAQFIAKNAGCKKEVRK